MTSADSRAIEFAPLRGFDAEEEADHLFHATEDRDLEDATSRKEDPNIYRAL